MCVVRRSSNRALKLGKALSTPPKVQLRIARLRRLYVSVEVILLRILTMSFGFSVGDFLNGATLAYDLIGALSSSCGSSLEYQQLIHELEIVRLTCMEIESLRSSQQVNRSLLNALTHLVRDCNKEMEQCSASVECYRESLQPGGSGSTIADSWKKMGWSLFKPRVIRSMRDRLQLKIACMNLLLSAGGCLGWSVILQYLQSGSRLTDTAW